MVWDQLSINKPHLVYIILGGFTSIFMLVSLFVKEKLYIGEATVATICGLIFGPHAANLIDPGTWGNTDQITLEFSRIVLVVQCFAVGVELPKAYMERHWLSVVLLLIPVMTFGWLITSLFIWWMIAPLTWLESLCAAACVTATDPVLASSVVGKGKFAKRVPKHIRDLLSAESGCNDGMAFPFIYLALNLIQYHLDAKHVVQHWFVNTILYECVWGAVYGVLVGYIARHAIKLAEKKGIIDRDSFLVFYFVLALFCAGSGSMLGMDDLLVGFAAGVGFSNDGWFTEKTEESHVSNVIDLLLNLTYFVYLGTIIPWDQFNSGLHGLDAWRLCVIAILVVFFRRIPIMLMLKPIIPDIKTWREALFCGHFGPIGVGAIFVAILARAELETHSTTPLAVLPNPDTAEYVLIYTIWPITTFLVITSIVVHGSSIAVFTLGKRINTLTLTLSYTQGNDKSSNWMERLPRIASRSKSEGRSIDSAWSEDEKAQYPPGELPPIGVPKLALRRQKDEDYEQEKPIGRPGIRSRSKKRKKNKNWGGPISESAIAPKRASEPNLLQKDSSPESPDERPSINRLKSDQLQKLESGDSDPEVSRARKEREKEEGKRERGPSESDEEQPADIEVYEEDDDMIIEDEEGNVVDTFNIQGKSEEEKAAMIEKARLRLTKDESGKFAKHKHESHAKTEGEEIMKETVDAAEHPQKHFRDQFKGWVGFGKKDKDKEQHEEQEVPSKQKSERKRGPAHAYQFGNTIIVEDEDGEVIQKYEIPRDEQEQNRYNEYMRTGMKRMGTWVGVGRRQSQAPGSAEAPPMIGDPSKEEDIEDTSTSSPDKEKQEVDLTKIPTAADKKPKKPQPQREQSRLNDDGLRIAISNAEEYGLMGLRKPRAGERPNMSMAGRKMSAVDFIQQMQQMDKQKRKQVMNEAGVGKEKQDEIQRTVSRRNQQEEDRPRPLARAGTMPLSKVRSPIAEDQQAEDDADDGPKDYFTSRKRSQPEHSQREQQPEPGRTQSEESGATHESDDEEPEIPTHNVRSTIARYGRGGTAAQARRDRHKSSAQAEPRIEEDADEADGEEETAAEKRRRLAALGLGGSNDSDSSSDDDDGPRTTNAVPEPGEDPYEAPAPARAREKLAEAPRMRVQWGGETRGAVRGQGDDEEAQKGAVGGSGSGTAHAGVGSKIKGFLNR